MENNTRLIETLIRGRDFTKQLQSLLQRKDNLDGSVSVSVLAEDLLMEILGSFSGGISMLSSTVSGEIYGFPASPVGNLVDKSPEEAHSGKKPVSVVKERRGCYKRRRTIDSYEKISVTMEDGFAWRKYGQKEIHNSKFPRCYFRCTHKHGHGCKALEQVQKMEDGSNNYHITYLGHHTCPNLSHHGVVLDFENHPNVSDSPSTITNIHIDPSIKQEVVDSKDQSIDISDNVSSANDVNSSSPISWNEVFMGDLGSLIMRVDNEDSCTTSTSSHGYLNDFLNNDDLLSESLLFLDQSHG
ncbi:hypothetical protein QVD17_35798 [Tagetes erecta]|uniref:WRKY domain-containing protein n=1 Tax=Tagetes erecta TaxID=13708 RepID=A0AAD8JV25_TARER|nr:hypothetical protein QVD17_35798 [Tagetes erecta]